MAIAGRDDQSLLSNLLKKTVAEDAEEFIHQTFSAPDDSMNASSEEDFVLSAPSLTSQEVFHEEIEFQQKNLNTPSFDKEESAGKEDTIENVENCQIDGTHEYCQSVGQLEDQEDYKSQECSDHQQQNQGQEQLQAQGHERYERFESQKYLENVGRCNDLQHHDIPQPNEKNKESEESCIEQRTPQDLRYAEERVRRCNLSKRQVKCDEAHQNVVKLDNEYLSALSETDHFAVEKRRLAPDTADTAMTSAFHLEAALASTEHTMGQKKTVAGTLCGSGETEVLQMQRCFEEIKRNLQEKNIVGSLQSQPKHVHQRAEEVDMESPRSGGYSGQNSNSPIKGNEPPNHSKYRPSNDDSWGRPMKNRDNNKEDGRNVPAGIAQIRQSLSLPDLQLSHVTVFQDRAELVRTISPVFKAGEIAEILLENVSSAMDKDSIRVELRGAATILDVTYTARTVPGLEETWAQGMADLQTELRQCHRQIESIIGRLARLEKQRIVLDTFADGMTIKTENAVFATVLPQPSSSPPVPNPLQQDKQDNKHSKRAFATHEDSITTNLSKRCVSELNPFDPVHMDTLQRFLTMYEDQAERLDTSILSSKEELDRSNDRAEQIEKELANLQKLHNNNLVREISVLIEPRDDGPVDMLITYVVSQCLWKPAYDIRLFNSDGSMKVIYYGLVQQSTGEDWEPRRMTLSTAQPSSEGLCPSLGLQRLHYKQTESSIGREENFLAAKQGQRKKDIRVQNGGSSGSPRPLSPSLVNVYGPATATVIPQEEVAIVGNYLVATLPRSRHSSMSNDSLRQRRSTLRSNSTYFAESPRVASTPLGTMQRRASHSEINTGTLRGSSISRATSRQALGTSLLVNCAPPSESRNPPATKMASSAVATVTFEVPRPPAIVPCDNEEVRVTVGLIDLQPSFDYVTVPKRSLSAFLKASVKNSGNFYILPGQTNIYSDNAFIGKSELGAVAPGEDLTCDLGAETGIEVIYRPMFKSKENASGQKSIVNFKQIIGVHNTFQRPVRVMVVDQLPASGEEKIKVNLIEPNIKNLDKYDKKKPIRVNKHHNIEWDLDLNAGETKEVVLRYAVEYPAAEQLKAIVADE